MLLKSRRSLKWALAAGAAALVIAVLRSRELVDEDGVPEITELCEDGDHDECSHWRGFSISHPFKRGGPVSDVLLCQCRCHDDCPAAVGPTVRESIWLTSCTCPGSTDMRGEMQTRREESHAEREKMRAAIRTVDPGHGRSAEELRVDFEDAYRAHDVDISPGILRWQADLVEAATGPRLFRTARVIRVYIHGAQRLLERVRNLGHGDDDDEGAPDIPHDGGWSPAP